MPKRLLFVLMVAIPFLAACGGATDQDPRTETIEPVAAPVGNGTEDAIITQTTEIGEERSPSEGGVLSTPGGGGAEFGPGATTTGSPTPSSAKPPAKPPTGK